MDEGCSVQITSAVVSFKKNLPFCTSYESVIGTWPLKTMRYLPKGRCWHIIGGEGMEISLRRVRLAEGATRRITGLIASRSNNYSTMLSFHQGSHLSSCLCSLSDFKCPCAHHLFIFVYSVVSLLLLRPCRQTPTPTQIPHWLHSATKDDVVKEEIGT